MNLDKYKCGMCKCIFETEFVFNCVDCDRMFCGSCKVIPDNTRICNCLKIKIKNPLFLLVEERSESSKTRQCNYKSAGCTWKFSDESMKTHLQECKYRPYNCVGAILGVWRCNWEGKQLNFADHMQNAHTDMGETFSYFQNASLPFIENRSTKTMNLVDAFSRRYVFYYHSDINKKMVYFIIYLLGRKEDADKYLVDFEITSPQEKHRKVKFVELCFSDSENIKDIIEKERCVALSYNVIRSYLVKNRIYIRFIIKRKDDDETDIVNSETKPKLKIGDTIKDNLNNSKPLAIEKGTSKTNIKKSLSDITPSTANNQSPPKTSINKLQSSFSLPNSPFSSPSITKNNTPLENRQTGSHGLKNSVQPYKCIDDKMYRNKYPPSCLSKPTFKK